MTGETVQKLVDAILDADRTKAHDMLEEYALNQSYSSAASNVLEPALYRIGELWETTGDVSLAQAYVAAKVAGDFMTVMAEKDPQADIQTQKKGIVVIGNIEDDFHSLGRNMVTVFLERDGWTVHDLGNDVLAEEFVDRALEHGADIIAVSAMMFSTAINIRKIREELDHRGLTRRIMLAVGGAVFKLRPELVEEVGGDGTAPNAIRTPELFEDLRKQIEKEGEE